MFRLYFRHVFRQLHGARVPVARADRPRAQLVLQRIQRSASSKVGVTCVRLVGILTSSVFATPFKRIVNLVGIGFLKLP